MLPTDCLVFDRAGIRAVDRCAILELGIAALDLMERAASAATGLAMTMLGSGSRVLIVCGSGNNGGDGWAMARLLQQAGHDVHVRASKPPRADSDAAVNESAARDMKIVCTADGPLPAADLLVDALLGTGLDRPLSPDAVSCIEAMNSHTAPVLAIDLPSGLDADSGRPRPVAVRATTTATFVGLKCGMLAPEAAPFLGRVHVLDIGVPPEIARRLARSGPDVLAD
jgi:NAD(P)H-hydrate epimerase